MSATRRQPSKAVRYSKALAKGAEYAVKGAGATSIGLGALGAFVALSNPITLAIVGGVGALFCCVGGCAQLQQDDVLPAEEKKSVETITNTSERVSVSYLAGQSFLNNRSPVTITLAEEKKSESKSFQR